MKRLVAVLALVACSKQSTSSVTLSAPSSSSSAPVVASSTVASRLCGRVAKDPYEHVSAQAASLVKAATAGDRYHEFPQMPEPPAEVIEGAALELRDANVRRAFEHLDTTSVAVLEKANAKWCIAVALGNADIDVRIVAARALGRLRDPAPAHYLTEIARASAVFVPGSEAATLQGISMHAFAEALDACTGEHVRLADGQDPEGLAAGAVVWKKKLCATP